MNDYFVRKIPIKHDMSGRKYYRVELSSDFAGSRTAILMEGVPDNHPDAVAGHKICDYVYIGEALRKAGLSVPEIYDYDVDKGYMLIEDFGDVSFSDKISKGENIENLYCLAVDILLKMGKSKELSSLNLKSYYDGHIHENKKFVMEFYVPLVKGEDCSSALVNEYKNIWNKIEGNFPSCPMKFQHIDFFPGNLMYRENMEGLNRCGIIDFQGAQIAPYVYDIVNLLEDARRDVDENLKKEMKKRFCGNMNKCEKEEFEIWYIILSAQFHLRLIGQFIKIKNIKKNDSYMQYIPRVEAYIRKELQYSILKDMKYFFDELNINFDYFS